MGSWFYLFCIFLAQHTVTGIIFIRCSKCYCFLKNYGSTVDLQETWKIQNKVPYVCVHAQLFLTLCDPRDYNLPDSSVHEIFQARISALLFPSLGDLPDPGIKPTSPVSPALQANSLPLSHQGSLQRVWPSSSNFFSIPFSLLSFLFLSPSLSCSFFPSFLPCCLSRNASELLSKQILIMQYSIIDQNGQAVLRTYSSYS